MYMIEKTKPTLVPSFFPFFPQYFSAASGVAQAAGDLTRQVNTVTHWMGLKAVDITAQELTDYCGSVSVFSLFRHLHLLYVFTCVY